MPVTGHDYCDTDPVVAQYERWQYPAPVDDLTSPAVAKYLNSYCFLRDLAPAYWPAGAPRENLDILVAGCGTMAAACMARFFPNCNVVGIDISTASLAHEQRLKERHNLANLSLHRLPIEEAGSLGTEFDYISCHGVLHHLPDPTQGLRALGGVLRRDGVIGLMVYAKYGRAQVYAFQELFRMMGLEQSSADLAIVRDVIGGLPSDHPLKNYLRRAVDLNSDAGMVDTFLHRRDRSYSVAECLELVRESGLVFQGWDQNFFYHPDGLFASSQPFRERLAKLPPEQVWQAVELASSLVGMHWFHACRADRDPARWQMPWDSSRLLECVPYRTGQLVQIPGPDGRPQPAMQRAGLLPIVLKPVQAAIFAQINGQRTVRQCLMAAGIAETAEGFDATAREFFHLMWRTSNGLLRLPK